MMTHAPNLGLAAQWRALQGQRWRWRPFSRPHGVYLGLPQHGPLQADDDAALSDTLVAFADWCAAHPGERCELAVGSAATLWHVAQAEGGGRDALAQAWQQAFSNWAHYFDIDLQDPVALSRWQLQEAALPGACLLAATPIALTQGLLDVAQQHGVKVDWMGAWWLRGLANTLQQGLPEAAAEGREPMPACALVLTEPGCGWRVALRTAGAGQAGPMAGTLAKAWDRCRGARAWQLAGLSMDDGLVQPDQAPWVAAGPADRGDRVARVALDLPGAGGERASCQDIDLALLRGQSADWNLTWA